VLAGGRYESGMSKRPDPRLARIAAAAASASIRSPLGRWLEQNHDDFAAMLKQHRPRWDALAAAVAAEGFTDARGNPPNGRSLKRAWERAQVRIRERQETAPNSGGGRRTTPAPAVSDAGATRAPGARGRGSRSAAARPSAGPDHANAEEAGPPGKPQPSAQAERNGGAGALARLQAELDRRSGRKTDGET